MQEWHYCSLRWTNEHLCLLTYHDNGVFSEEIPLDPLIDSNNPAITLRRWIASLGRQGWELTGILRDDEGQEWVLKHPLDS